MSELKIIAAQLPPAHLDDGDALSTKLLSEWIDIENAGDEPVAFSTVLVREVSKLKAINNEEDPNRTFWTGAGEKHLLPGQILRIHTGDMRDEDVMLAADKRGANWHADAGFDDFFLNRDEVAGLILSWRNSSGETLTDRVSYVPLPHYGAFLQRKGSKLAAAAATSGKP